MTSERPRTASSRFWKCKNCGAENQINVRRKVIRTTFLCVKCKEQVYVFDIKGGSQYTKHDPEYLLQVLPSR
ncbi:hypothetical protein MUP77_16550 [Candidatus Bathyarchaeota archaeon]|nr:hypothetical protein [Candidatus Bathyarchaeota archaeon]